MDGSRAAAAEAARIEEDYQLQQIMNRQGMTAMGTFDEQAAGKQNGWQKHLHREANRIRPSAPDERLRDDDDEEPFDVEGFAHAVGTVVAERGSNFMAKLPGKRHLNYITTSRDRFYICANVFV